MFLPVLMLKLLLISPGHIYFVSLEFLHICTPLTPQTSACDSRWHCELLGYMKADESGWPCPISLWGTLSSSKIHLSVPWTPYDRVMLISAISVLFPKHTANCGSIAFLGFLWWQLWKLYHCEVQDSKEGTGETATVIHKKQYVQTVLGCEFGSCTVGLKWTSLTCLSKEKDWVCLREGLEYSLRCLASWGSRLSVLSLCDLEIQSLYINSGANQIWFAAWVAM